MSPPRHRECPYRSEQRCPEAAIVVIDATLILLDRGSQEGNPKDIRIPNRIVASRDTDRQEVGSLTPVMGEGSRCRTFVGLLSFRSFFVPGAFRSRKPPQTTRH